MSTNIASFLTPANIQGEIAMFGMFVAGAASPATKSILTTLANDLLALATANVTVAQVDDLIAATKLKIPVADQAIVSFVLTGVLGILNLILNSFAGHNAQIVAYVNAVANGILEAGL